MTNPTAREVIIGSIDSCYLSDEQADRIVAALNRAGKEIVDNGAVEAERESCAMISDGENRRSKGRQPFHISDEVWAELMASEKGWADAGKNIAAAIRARGKE